MIVRHIIKSAKDKWLSLMLLGFIIALSSMVYTAVSLGVGSIEDSTNDYLDTYIQEDFSIQTSPLITTFDHPTLQDCNVSAFTLQSVYQDDLACYYEVLNARKEALEGVKGIHLETRLHKDVTLNANDETHDLRVFYDSETINLTYLNSGELPQNDNEVALLENYLNNNSLAVGDTVVINDQSFEITGTILFPDYTLPAIHHPLLFTTDFQSLALMHEEGFERLSVAPNVDIAGIFIDGAFDINHALEAQDEPFFMNSILTENNMRSGLIYTEIEGTRGTAVFLSVLIAFMGIVIVGLILKKMIEQSRRPFGILRALGIKNHELMRPFILIISLYSLLFLFIGYLTGVYLAPYIQSLFLDFYLLPSQAIRMDIMTFFVATMVPLITIILMAFVILNLLIKKNPLDLIFLKPNRLKPYGFNVFKKIGSKLSYMGKMQVAFLSRNFMKTLMFIIGSFFALIMLFIALGMEGIFEGTIDGYYDSIEVRYIGYLEAIGDLNNPDSEEKVIEMPGQIDDHSAFLVGLEPSSNLHPLKDSNKQLINDDLKEGLIITESFALLSGVSKGDEVNVRVGGEMFSIEVKAIADIYPGEHVFIERSLLALKVTDDASFYNAVYSREPLDSDQFSNVFNVQTIQRSLNEINDIMTNILYVVMASGLMMGVIIVYLLSVLTVEDHYYNIALLKVLGYHDKEINKMLLGGYDKITFILFLLAIPATLLIYHALTAFIAMEYNMVLPFHLKWYYIIIVGLLYGMIYIAASYKAKQKIKSTSLQAALKIYQH